MEETRTASGVGSHARRGDVMALVVLESWESRFAELDETQRMDGLEASNLWNLL